jgi:hypothetical protein
MTTLNPNKKERVAFSFFEYRIRSDAEDYAEKGEGSVLDYVSKGRLKAFNSAVKDLEDIGCHREILLCNLYRLKHATDHFRDRRRILADANAIANAAEHIRWLQKANIPQALLPVYPTTDSSSFLASQRLPELLDECALFLHTWWTPRKDLLISYARAANCLYPTIVSEPPPNLNNS